MQVREKVQPEFASDPIWPKTSGFEMACTYDQKCILTRVTAVLDLENLLVSTECAILYKYNTQISNIDQRKKHAALIVASMHQC